MGSETQHESGMSRRDLLAMVGMAAGSAAMYQAMTSLGLAGESTYRGSPNLTGAPKGTSVLILGAGLAGLTAAYELRKAGYKVSILEYNERSGGRNWSIRGGDKITELGGETQTCGFAKGHYFNPGPWRIPYNHHAVIDYCRQLGVALEPFACLNHNAYFHSTNAFGGKPQRIREIDADLRGHVADLLAKTAQQDKLDESVSKEDKEVLLAALKNWGGLDNENRYTKSAAAASLRGYDRYPGGGVAGPSVPSEPMKLQDLLKSGLWRNLNNFFQFEHQNTMLQPVGGMDMIGKGFAKQLGGLIRYNAKVTEIKQDERGVTVTYVDQKAKGSPKQVKADWCVCTIPASILSQIPTTVSAKMKAAIDAVPYVTSVKVGLQFKRRFWEEDEMIYGGISSTNLPINTISYPSDNFGSKGPGVLLGAYQIVQANSFALASMSAPERIAFALENGSKIHPQYKKEFDNGVAVSWHRVPFTLGCGGMWNPTTRKDHYNNICQIDGRMVLAGEHVSYVNWWQEGAILSALDAITRLHERIVKAKA